MNLPKAIELLQQDLDDPGSVDITDLNQAQELGIEALKRVKYVRETYQKSSYVLLPDETKDWERGDTMKRGLAISLLLLHLAGESMIELAIDPLEWTDSYYGHQN